MNQKLLGVLSLIILSVACGGGGGGGSSSEDAYEGESLFNAGTNAIRSSMSTSSGDTLGDGVTSSFVSSIRGEKSASAFKCDEYGSVTMANNSAVDLSGMDNYAAAAFYCMTTTEPEVPTTALGALKQSSSILCSIGDLVIDGQAHDYEASMKGCFSDDFINDVFGGTETFTGSYTATELSDSDWDKEIQFTTSFGITYGRFKFRDSNGVKAIAYVGQQSSQVTGWTVVISDSKLIYEMKYYKADGSCENDGSCNSHNRLLIEGEFASNGTSFSSISKIEGIIADNNPDKGDNDYGASRVVTIKGTGSAMKTQQYDSASISSYSDLQTASNWRSTNPKPCLPSGASCTGNSGITFSTDSDFSSFLTDSESTSHAKDWYDAMTSPLDFSSVNTASTQN